MTVISPAIAVFRLTLFQLLGWRRMWWVLLLCLAPSGLVFVSHLSEKLRFFGQTPENAYAEVLMGMYTMVIVPFLGVFWGTSLVRDEVERRTLVYLLTRPVGRARLFVLKFLAMGLCMALLLGFSVATVFFAAYAGFEESLLRSEMPKIIWDTRALVLGGLAYAALGLMLGAAFKWSLMGSMIYVFACDGTMQFLPGFLKQFSIRHHMYVLSTQPNYGAPTGMLQFLAENTTTENEALIWLSSAIVVFLVVAVFVLRRREYDQADAGSTT